MAKRKKDKEKEKQQLTRNSTKSKILSITNPVKPGGKLRCHGMVSWVIPQTTFYNNATRAHSTSLKMV
jgi:hypothetical protein